MGSFGDLVGIWIIFSFGFITFILLAALFVTYPILFVVLLIIGIILWLMKSE